MGFKVDDQSDYCRLQRAWTASAIRREVTTRGWGKSGRGAGVLAEGNFDVCRRLDEMRSKADTADKHAEIRVAALKSQTGMTGYGPRKDKERALRLRGALAERQARHEEHEKASRYAPISYNDICLMFAFKPERSNAQRNVLQKIRS